MITSHTPPPWAIKLLYTVLIINITFWWYHLLSPSPGTFSIESAFPLFESQNSFDVVSPKDNQAWAYRVFRTSTHRPPHMTVSSNGKELSKGYYFITPQNGPRGEIIDNSGAYVMRNDSELVYALSNITNPENLRVQAITGARYMTAWTGTKASGHGYGELVVIDDEYVKSTVNLEAVITQYSGQNLGGSIDFHEQQVTARGTILVTAYNTTSADLSRIGGKEDGYIADSMFFEIDIETQRVIFEWSAFELFDVSKSRLPLDTAKDVGSRTNPYDFFHLNSVQAIGSDAYLISSRHFWSVYLISRVTGSVIWELAGGTKGGNFAAVPAAGRFRWQSHVRAYNASSSGMIISMFDNHNVQENNGKTPSRGLLFQVHFPVSATQQPDVLRIVQPEVPRYSFNGGSYQPGLSNNNQLISYGQIPLIQEFGPGDGSDLRWEGRFGNDDITQSYRVFKAKWEATPKRWAPSLLIEKPGTSLRGWVSWNGATDIEEWRLYSVERGHMMRPLGKTIWRGFETAFDVPDHLNEITCIMAVAWRNGREVRQSNTACLEGVMFKAEPLENPTQLTD